jgi:hypothetical protein
MARNSSQSPQANRGGTTSQEGFPTEAARSNIKATDDTESARVIDQPLSPAASPEQGVSGNQLK